MSFTDNHIDPKLWGQPKGVRVALQERKLIWHKFTTICTKHRTKIVGKCASCAKSEMCKDAERRIALAEVMGQDDAMTAEDTTLTESEAQSNAD
jgi:hypothetical protein